MLICSKTKIGLKVSILFVCLGLFSTVSAQDLALGIKLGLNRSSFAGQLPTLTDTDESYNFKNGYNLGIVFTYTLSNSFAFTAEANYVLKGSMHQSISDTELIQKDIQLNYLEIPVLTRFCFFNGRSNIFAGPSLNIFISGAEDQHWMSLSSPVYEDPIEWDIKNFNVSDDYRVIEISVVSGFAFQYPVAEDLLLYLDFRFSYGLTDIKKDLFMGNQMSLSTNVALTFPF